MDEDKNHPQQGYEVAQDVWARGQNTNGDVRQRRPKSDFFSSVTQRKSVVSAVAANATRLEKLQSYDSIRYIGWFLRKGPPGG